MNASQIFAAAHAAARTATTGTYRLRFATALRNAWAAAKQPAEPTKALRFTGVTSRGQQVEVVTIVKATSWTSTVNGHKVGLTDAQGISAVMFSAEAALAVFGVDTKGQSVRVKLTRSFRPLVEAARKELGYDPHALAKLDRAVDRAFHQY